jgi:hypothetical protein
MKHEMIKNEECNNYLPPLLAGWIPGGGIVVAIPAMVDVNA